MIQSAAVEGPPVDARDASEFEAVARREARRLFGIAYTILRDPADAEDAVQDVMVRAWRAWHRTEGFGDQGPWLTRICVNRCLSHRIRLRQRHSRETELGVQAAAATPAPSDPELARAFDRLSARQRAVVLLHYYSGYSLNECAELIGCRPGTARSHLHRALVALREVMNP
jgi:RNA polymerase sigma-70 factor (ECF subfamily)